MAFRRARRAVRTFRRRVTRRIRGFRRSTAPTTGILPATYGGLSAASVFLAPDDNGYSIASDIEQAFKTKSAAPLQNIPGHALAALPTSLKLAAASAGTALAGKYLHLRGATRITKKVSLF